MVGIPRLMHPSQRPYSPEEPIALRKIIAVFGSSQPRPGSVHYEEARRVGRALAEAGWQVVTGGYRGVMEAASLGAREGGGTTIGVTTSFFAEKNLMPNPYVDEEILMPSYAGRLLKLVEISDGYVVMSGGSGTLSELFVCWELEKNGSIPAKPLVLFGDQWTRIMDFLAETLKDERSFSSYRHLLHFCSDTEHLVRIIRDRLTAD